MSNPALYVAVIGALVAVIGTALVHGLVVPWAQARTRRRERWEKSVSQLHSTLGHELRAAVTRHQTVASLMSTVRRARADPEADQTRVVRMYEQLFAEQRTHGEVLDAEVRRMIEAGGIVRSLLDPGFAPYLNVWLHENRVQYAVLKLRALPDDTSEEAATAALKEAWSAIETYAAIIEPMAMTLALPRPSTIQRLKRRLRRVWRAITRRAEAAGPAAPAEAPPLPAQSVPEVSN